MKRGSLPPDPHSTLNSTPVNKPFHLGMLGVESIALLLPVSHTHHLVPQSYFQDSRLMICKSCGVKEVVGDDQVQHAVIVGGKIHCWWDDRKWAAVSPPEKFPLGGKNRAGLGVLKSQASISSLVKDGREPAGHEQELLLAAWGTREHFLASWGMRRSHKAKWQRHPASTSHCTIPPPSCQSVQQPMKEQWPTDCLPRPISRMRKAEVCVFGKCYVQLGGHMFPVSLKSTLTKRGESRTFV